jgi:transposase
LRDRVLEAEGGPREVARRFGVSSSYVTKARQRRDRLGDVRPGAQRGHVAAKLAGHEDALRAEVACRPDATLAELCAWARQALGVTVSVSGLSVRLRRLRLTLKKVACRGRADPPKGRRGTPGLGYAEASA